jgi:[protein-PII] uridylyltransferase
VKLDHSVRTPAECTEVAGRELSAGIGLLDLRGIAGDLPMAAAARTALLQAWRNGARKRLPELLEALEERHRTQGDAAYLLEPDLKEARGGFRDMIILKSLAATWLTDRPHGVRQPYDRLLDVRDALHVTSGRAVDRLLASEAAEIARLLGYATPERPGTDDLHRAVSLAARQIAHAVDLTARAAQRSLPQRRVLSFARRERRPQYDSAPHGLIVHEGEVGLDRTTSASDPYVGLQAGALAAQRGLVLSPVTAENLGLHAPELPIPWPDPAREALLELLSSGPAVLPVWEALDLAGCVSRWIPQWDRIRALPQHNPVHRHTVDRHSVQTVAEAGRALTQVSRPDLLLLAALFHDIGKGRGGGVHHAATGAPVAREIVTAIGLDAADADLIELLVREHLTLAELATRRDHADPRTLEALIQAVGGSPETLGLLRHLTEADARAAGPAAWSPWRAQLIHGLADRADSLLLGDTERAAAPAVAGTGLARSVLLDGRPRITVVSTPGGLQLTIAARDRLGLFSDIAGLLAAHDVTVRSAVLSVLDGVAVNLWRTGTTQQVDLPDPAYLVKQLERLEAGDPDVLTAVRRRERRSARQPSEPFVHLIPEASSRATVVEVRVGDRSGLLYALGAAVAAEQISIVSAHISTLAGQAIDTFYLTEADGRPLDESRGRLAVEALGAAAAGTAELPDRRTAAAESA